MKRVFALASLLVMTAGLSFAGSYTGYVTDMKCAKAGKAGEAHAGCAKGCIKGGEAAVLVGEDGEVIEVADQEKIKEFAGQKVTVEGEMADGKLSIESVEPAS